MHGKMVAISMYRGNLHRGGAVAARRWPVPRPTLSVSRFRRLLRSRSLAVSRLAGALQLGSPTSSPNSRLDDGAAEPVGVAEEVGEEEQQEEEGQDDQQQEEEGQDEQQHQEEEQQQQEEGAVEDVDMDDAGEVVVGGDAADGNGDAEEGQGESEGFDPNPEVSYLDGIEERKRDLSDKLDTLNKKKHDLVQMLKQILNAEEEIRTRSMQASLRAAMPQPSENAADGSFVSRQAPRMTVDVNFSEIAGESDAGSNQGTPGRPLHHVHSISPSTASFVRSPFGSLQYNSALAETMLDNSENETTNGAANYSSKFNSSNSHDFLEVHGFGNCKGHTPRSPATFSTASPSRFAANGHQGHAPSHPSVSLPGNNFVASSHSPAASGGSSSVFRDYRPPNST